MNILHFVAQLILTGKRRVVIRASYHCLRNWFLFTFLSYDVLATKVGNVHLIIGGVVLNIPGIEMLGGNIFEKYGGIIQVRRYVWNCCAFAYAALTGVDRFGVDLFSEGRTSCLIRNSYCELEKFTCKAYPQPYAVKHCILKITVE